MCAVVITTVTNNQVARKRMKEVNLHINTLYTLYIYIYNMILVLYRINNINI